MKLENPIRFNTIISSILCLWLLSLIGCQSSPPSQPRNVILIGWDGAQRNHVQECLARQELPNLARLSGEGSLVAIDIYRTTDTKSGWSQILTGYEPEITGVYSNGRYRPIPAGYTVFERLEEHFGPDNFVTVAVIGKKGHVDAAGPVKKKIKPAAESKSDQNENQAAQKTKKAGKKQAQGKAKRPEGKIVEENGVKYRVIPGKPYFHTKNNVDVFINGLIQDEKVGSKTLELLEKYKDQPFFFFVHFAEVDHSGHRAGENSLAYNDALISADTWTGRIMDKLLELGLYDETLIYVTADHGFDEDQKGHKDAPYVFLATNDPLVRRRGERADITPTILDRFGVDLPAIDPPLSGHSLLRAYQPPLWQAE